MEPGEKRLSPEENSLLEMMSILIEEHDREDYPLSPSQPHRMLAFLLEERGLKPRELWPVLESKSRVSEILSGNRAISKAQAKKLAEFFHVLADLFIPREGPSEGPSEGMIESGEWPPRTGRREGEPAERRREIGRPHPKSGHGPGDQESLRLRFLRNERACGPSK